MFDRNTFRRRRPLSWLAMRFRLWCKECELTLGAVYDRRSNSSFRKKRAPSRDEWLDAVLLT